MRYLQSRISQHGQRPLKEYRVATETLERYQAAMYDFVSYWQANRGKPRTLLGLDASVAAYIEALWAEGGLMGTAADTLSSLSFVCPFVRGLPSKEKVQLKRSTPRRVAV